MSKPIISTDFKDIKLFKRGKVRDVYQVEDKLLIISTDRISAFDVVLPSGIPSKGMVLNQISLFWFDFLKDIISNHLICSDVNEFPSQLKPYHDILAKRSVLVKKTKPLAFECVVRGYLSGSAYKEYIKSKTVCGIKLPDNLKDSSKLPEAIFTPSTKEETGHDINVTTKVMEDSLGKETTNFIKEVSLKLYKKAANYAESKGIIIADTKFEFGFYNDKIILIDEVLTPDSSRFWPKDKYAPGKGQPSFDKQFVRDYLETLNWDKAYPGPNLPQEIIAKTEELYKDALRLLTGQLV